jgi:carboxyl-terminal processing protease
MNGVSTVFFAHRARKSGGEMAGQQSRFRRLISALTAICILFTIVTGAFIVTNFRNVIRMLEVGLLVKTQSLQPVTADQLLEGAVRGMVSSLEDPYSSFMTNQEFLEMQRYIQGSIGGIGIYVGIKDKNIVVQAPIEGTPAHKAGILSEDIIVKINETFTTELNYDEAVAMMRGEPGTQVKISIMRKGINNLLEFTLTREIIDLPTVSGEVLKDNPDIGSLLLINQA